MRTFSRLLTSLIVAVAAAFVPRAAAQPSISLPYSALSVELGQTASFSATVYGTSPFTFQWVLVSGSGSVNVSNGTTSSGSAISGATTRILGISGTTAADAGNYALKVTDANGLAVTSQTVALSVKPPTAPSITVQPTSLTVTAGNPVSFSINATGSYPRTYQWYKGTPPGGSAISGATANPFVVSYPLAADAGSYYVVVTNAQGSATSNSATLTVTPATPITITPTAPSPVVVTVGEPLSIWLSTSGSGPISYQWAKGGTAIPGATYSYYSITSATAADAGSYTLTASNAAGSVTSSTVSVTVNPPVAPVFTQSPQGASLAYGASLYLNASVTGTPSPTLQWYKDGVALQNGSYSSYSVNMVTAANAGTYTVTATNSGGKVTSAPAVVTVAAPIAPVITYQPASAAIALGYSAGFSVSATGSSPMTYVWKKDGQVIPNETSSSYYISSVQTTHAGSYTVTITNAAGNVTSNAAVLTVTPPTAPVFYNYGTTSKSGTVGSTLSIDAPSIASGIGPITYQWYKNGTPISGAVLSYYTIASAQLTDSGNYVVTATNAGGTTAAPPILVTVVPPAGTGTPWIDAKQQGNVVYFLFANHIERFDLVSATWLGGATLSQTATTFCVASDGVYVGFGRTVSRFSLDLGSQTTLANIAGTADGIFSHGSNVYVITSSGTYPVNRQTGAVGTGLTALYSGSSPMPSSVVGDKVFTESSWGYSSLVFDANGGLTRTTRTSYIGYIQPEHLYIYPDQSRIVDTNGTVFYVGDDTVAGSFAGSSTDMTFLGDGTPVVLRDNVLTKYGGNGGFGETGRLALGTRGKSVFASGTTVTVFTPSTSTGNAYITATAIAASSLVPAAAVAAANPTGTTYTPNAIACDENGIVYLLSQPTANVFRWSSSTQAYLSSVPLTGTPSFIAYSPTRHRLYCVYPTGAVTEIDPSATNPVERPFGAFPKPVTAVEAADDFLLGSSEYSASILDSGGRVTYFGDSYYSSSFTWSHAAQTFFGVSTGAINSVALTPAGKLTSNASFGYYTSNLAGPVFPSTDGRRVITASGHVYAGDLSAAAGSLPNAIVDAVWLGGGPVTLRPLAGKSEIQSWWPTNLKLSSSIQVAGNPIALFSLSGNRVMVVTQDAGAPAFTILNSDLQPTFSTVAATSTGAPVFTLQPSGSISVFVGSNVSLAVATSGATPQTFQWSKNGNAIPGATSSVLRFASLATSDGGNYSVVATNSQGSATSGTVTVGAFPLLQITSQPVSQTVVYGSSATLTVGLLNPAEGSIQWYRNGTAIPGANSTTLVTDKVYSVATGGDRYTVAITNTAGTVFSNPALVTTTQASSPQITTPPASTSVSIGGQAVFRVTATGSAPLTYAWSLNGFPIAGATNESYAVVNAAPKDAGTYTVTVSNSWGSITSAGATLTVGGLPTIVEQPASLATTTGASVTLSVIVSSPTTVTYQWTLNGASISGATSSTYRIASVQTSSAGAYSVVVTNAAGSVTSATAVLTVNGGTIPVFIKAPQSQTVDMGATVTFDVVVSGVAPFTYQWYFNGQPVVGATNATLTLTNVSSASAGTYAVTVYSANGGGAAGSEGASLTVRPKSYAGVYFGTFPTGGRWALYVRSDNTGQFIASLPQNLGPVVWTVVVASNGTFNSLPTPQAMSDAPTSGRPAFASVTSSLVGSISGSTVSASITAASLTMTGALDAGSSPFAGLYSASALNGGRGSTYTVVGGSGAALVLSVSDTASDYASGTVNAVGQLSATTTGGSAVAASIDAGSGYLAATITAPDSGGATRYGGLVSGAQNTTRLRNVSVRGVASSGADVLIGGFSVTGGTKQMLIRGIGPTLGTFGVEGALKNPLLSAYGPAGALLWSGMAWGGSTSVRDVFTRVGAFGLDASSADSAAVLLVNTNTTIQVAPISGTSGVALAEIYDADDASSGARLVNLSGRSNTGSGSAVLSAGFVIGGNGTATVLLRGIGPALTGYGVPGALSAAQLTLFDGNSKPIASNSGWGNDSALSAASSKVGAFALTPNSADAVLLVNLAPGNYTVQVAGKDGATGVALVEIYEVR